MAAGAVVDLSVLCPPGPMVVVAPHPDDETLGCGGVIALAAAAGRSVTVAILTDGAGSHPGSIAWPPARLARHRRQEARNAVSILGGEGVKLQTFPGRDGRLTDYMDAASVWLSALLAETGAASVFVTWDADPHPDHQAANQIVKQATAGTGVTAWAYPVWGLTLPSDAAAGEIADCVNLDIQNVGDRKRRAIHAHRTQVSDLIADCPNGFRLSPTDISRHTGPLETYLRVR